MSVVPKIREGNCNKYRKMPNYFYYQRNDLRSVVVFFFNISSSKTHSLRYNNDDGFARKRFPFMKQKKLQNVTDSLEHEYNKKMVSNHPGVRYYFTILRFQKSGNNVIISLHKFHTDRNVMSYKIYKFYRVCV